MSELPSVSGAREQGWLLPELHDACRILPVCPQGVSMAAASWGGFYDGDWVGSREWKLLVWERSLH